MKEKELREVAVCGVCNKPIGKSGVPLFWRIRIERYGLKAGAIQRQQGLAMMMGGHGLLASVMGPNEDLAEKISSKEITVCNDCDMKSVRIASLAME